MHARQHAALEPQLEPAGMPGSNRGNTLLGEAAQSRAMYCGTMKGEFLAWES